jgi:hypothetical protein
VPVKVGVEACGHYHQPLLTASAWPAGWEVLEPVGPHRPLPLLAAGNAAGDIEMLTAARFALLVRHDDADREHAYQDPALLDPAAVAGPWSASAAGRPTDDAATAALARRPDRGAAGTPTSMGAGLHRPLPGMAEAVRGTVRHLSYSAPSYQARRPAAPGWRCGPAARRGVRSASPSRSPAAGPGRSPGPLVPG